MKPTGIASGYTYPGGMSGASIAELFQVSGAALRKWRDSGCPQNEDMTWDARAVVKWKLERERARAAEVALKEDQGDSPALERMREAKAAMAEIELGERLGMFCRIDDVEKQWGRVLVALKQRLLGLPSKMSKRLEQKDAREISKILTEAARDIITDTRDHMESLVEGEDDE